jgi:hypothetical protein
VPEQAMKIKEKSAYFNMIDCQQELISTGLRPRLAQGSLCALGQQQHHHH